MKRRRDDWYAIIRRRCEDLEYHLHRRKSEYPHFESNRSTAGFDYSNRDGFARLGCGNSEFLTHWSKASDHSIHCYRDSTNVELAVAPIGTEIAQLLATSMMNFTSRVRTVQFGQFVVFENHQTRYCAAKVRKVRDNTRQSPDDWVEFDYWILEDGTDDFSVFA